MVIKKFPPIESADEHGLLAFGGDTDPESLILAYKSGIFLWPPEKDVLAWFSPPIRTILFLDDFKINSRLNRDLKKKNFKLKINSNFEAVIKNCSLPRKNHQNTWITSEVIDGYTKLHKLGLCHSFETYENYILVAGLYGVSIGSMFAGESMFSNVTSGSKFALIGLVNYLKEKNVKWIDCQVMTPLLKSFGASNITRELYIKLLKKSIKEESIF